MISSRSILSLYLLMLVRTSDLHCADAYLHPPHHPSMVSKRFGVAVTSRNCVVLYGIFSRRNKQGELLKKMELAKEQSLQRELLEAGGDKQKLAEKLKLSDEEIRARNDRKRFEELLNSASALAYDMEKSSSYKTMAQEEEEMNAGFLRVDRIFEGDPAPIICFENLVSIKTENALGKTGAQYIVPWLHKSASKHKDFLLVLTDPREKSSELRMAIKSISSEISADVISRMIIVNADSPSENRKWLKKQGIDNIDVYSDEKREFMRDFTALGEKRWAICMFIVRDGKVERLVRDLDMNSASLVIKNAVQSLNE